MVITHNILLLIFSNTSLDGQKWIKTTPEKSLSEHIMKARRCNAQLVCALNLYSYDVMCKISTLSSLKVLKSLHQLIANSA